MTQPTWKRRADYLAGFMASQVWAEGALDSLSPEKDTKWLAERDGYLENNE